MSAISREQKLLSIVNKDKQIFTINIYRPSLLVGTRSESRFLEQFGQKFSIIINLFLWGSLKKYRSIEAQKLSQFISTAKDKRGVNYYYYKDFI